MTDNGGEISVGQRLGRIEEDIRAIKKHMDSRITKHRENNELAIEKLGESVISKVTEHERRLRVLETHDAQDEAVSKDRKWIIGVGVVGLGGLLLNFVMLLQVLGKV